MSSPQQQARGLINLATRGLDPKGLISEMVKEIREGSAGPYHIGSTIRINQPWSGTTVEGSPVSLQSGDVVSVVQANLGQLGQDKMVLLADGITRAVIPYKVLGEALIEQDPTAEGPDEFMDDSDTPDPSGAIPGSELGSAPTPDALAPPEAGGSATPASLLGGGVVGQPEPQDSPDAQVISGSAETQPAKAVEHAVQRRLGKMLDECKNPFVYKRINEIRRNLRTANDRRAYCEAYEMLFSNSSHSLTQLEKLFEEEPDDLPTDDDLEALTPEDRKKYIRKMRRKYQDTMSPPISDPEDVGDDTPSLPFDDQSEMPPVDDDEDVTPIVTEQAQQEEPEPDEETLATMGASDLRKYLFRYRRKYKDAVSATPDVQSDPPPPVPLERKKYQDPDAAVPEEPVIASDDDDEPLPQDVEGIPDSDEMTDLSPEERRRYIQRFRKKYRGKYQDTAPEDVDDLALECIKNTKSK